MITAKVVKKFPYVIQNLDPVINEKISKDFSDGVSSLVQVGPEKMIIPSQFREKADDYYNFEVRPGDVIITGYPRSGTTLTESMVWLILNDLNFDKAAKVDHSLRIPFFEAFSTVTDPTRRLKASKKMDTFISSLEILNNSKDERRVFKTHLHFNYLPSSLFDSGCKIIYLARHPKDVAVSFYHLQRNIPGRQFTGDFKTFFSYFKNGLVFFTPYWAHVQQGWEKREMENFRFLFYEDITNDLRKAVKEMTAFLGKDLSESQVDLLAENLEFDKFKKTTAKGIMTVNPDNVDNHFIRRGRIGGWTQYFTKDMNIEADKWISENVKKIGISYPIL